MPIYEYKCLNCGNKIEKMQKFSDELLTVCPQCEGKLEKQWSLSGFQFKGAGWYVTDYSDKGKNPDAAKSEANGDVKSESAKTEKNGESKTEPAKTASSAAETKSTGNATTSGAEKASEK